MARSKTAQEKARLNRERYAAQNKTGSNGNSSHEQHRVQKLLSNYGYCSRRDAEDLIAQGRVAVNGKKITLGDQATEQDKITVDGKRVRPERKTYILLHKPKGCVTAVKDTRYKTVMDYVKTKERVFPVGRLDKQTTGLLILTNDGDFANTVMHPKNEIKKTYLAALDRPLKKNDMRKIERGVELEEGFNTRPAHVYCVEPKLIQITIHEGKNRIVRKIFAALGYRVINLHRERIGKLSLSFLKPGRTRVLKRKPEL